MIGYQIALVFKFIGVALYAGGMAASFLSSSFVERKRAVHRVASPGLLLTWIAGFCLAEILHIRWTAPWILGGLVLSTVSQMALVYSVSGRASGDGRNIGTFSMSVVPFILVVALMVFRPS